MALFLLKIVRILPRSALTSLTPSNIIAHRFEKTRLRLKASLFDGWDMVANSECGYVCEKSKNKGLWLSHCSEKTLYLEARPCCTRLCCQ